MLYIRRNPLSRNWQIEQPERKTTMYCDPKRIWRVLLSLIYSAILLAGCGSVPSQGATNDALVDDPNAVTIPQAQDVFAPFIVPVQPHTTVIWHNDDAVAHTVMTTPEHNSF